jgi:hypothetical protein
MVLGGGGGDRSLWVRNRDIQATAHFHPVMRLSMVAAIRLPSLPHTSSWRGA